LVLALLLVSVFGVLAVAMVGFGETSARTLAGYRAQRARNLATDAALDGAVNRTRKDPTIGRDPAAFAADPCNPANHQVIYSHPATDTTPAIQVSCDVQSGGGSGRPKELGSPLPFSLLTLGDRRSPGVASSLGVRIAEPGPFSGTEWFDWLTQPNLTEYGIKFDRSRVAGVFPTGSVSTWNVRGDVFSNSSINIQEAPGQPAQVTPPDGAIGVTQARGGCVGVTNCRTVGWDFADGKGRDPNYVPIRQGAANDVPTKANGASLSAVTMDAAWLNTRVAECAAPGRIVKFQPGIYTSATQLNALMENAACKSATFWFQPDDRGTPADTSDDSTGTFYFDFRDAAQPVNDCGQYSADNIFGHGGDLAHQWCIAGRAEDFGGQRVLGGTPYNWLPEADQSTHEMRLVPGSAGNGSGLFGVLQVTQFSNSSNAKLIDGTTADMAMTSGRPGSSIWLKSFAEVPRGSYPSVDLELAHSATNAPRMNAPTVQVNYGSLLGGGTCGPYQLPSPPSDGTLETVKLSVRNPAAYADLSACMSSGDRMNGASVQYNVGRPSFAADPYPTAKLDGARLILTARDSSTTFPRPPSATDVGGDCDPEAPGVQFIFGGDSRVYVPNGGLELCGGVDPIDPANGKEIALFQPPATPRLQTTGVVASSANLGIDNPTYANAIAEPVLPNTATAGPAAANIRFSGSGSPGGTITLRFPGYTPPAGYTVAKTALRASYDSNNSCTNYFGAVSCSGTPSSFNLVGSGFSSDCTTPRNVALGNELQAAVYDTSPCLTSSRITSSFDVLWRAKADCGGYSCSASGQLDGIEIIVTLAPTDPNAKLRPASGCITASPNYAEGASDPDCALIKVDGSFTDVLSTRRGRMSIKGAAYLPSGVIDIDDSDVVYPFFSRGLIARHFRLKSFRYRTGYSEPVFNNWIDATPSERQVMFYACVKESGACTATDSAQQGRAFVTFEGVTSDPVVKSWSVQNR
jgi:hypothetical protein